MRPFLITLALFILTGTAHARGESPVGRRALSVSAPTTSYALPGGATTFVIPLKNSTRAGSLVFVNENAAAQGELAIAVSDRSLAADSPHWTSVEGKIRFRHKRLFTVSLVGVAANYVRLSFRVNPPANATGKAADTRPRPYKLARIASS